MRKIASVVVTHNMVLNTLVKKNLLEVENCSSDHLSKVPIFIRFLFIILKRV